jgi:hypothetical protein
MADAGSSEEELINPRLARLLAASFGLAVTEITTDAYDVAEWHGSNDDLLTTLESRHGFTAGTAAHYLQGLRTGLADLSPDPNHPT